MAAVLMVTSAVLWNGHSTAPLNTVGQIADALTLVERAEDYRIEYNTQRPHEAIAWNRPLEVHLGRASPTVPTFEQEEILPTT